MNDASRNSAITDDDDISRALDALKREIQQFYDDVPELPITPQIDPTECRRFVRDRFDFQSPIPIAELLHDVKGLMRKWTLHVTHPRCFGNFNPSVTLPSIVGDSLTALYNPQLAVWSTAPFAIEIENHVLNVFLNRFGFDVDSSIANFTSGGAEANMTAIITALTNRYPEYGNKGLGGLGISPSIYLSAGGHESFIKAAHATGIGRDAVRRVPADAGHRMDVDALTAMIQEDRDTDRQPLLVIGTAGTTAMGVIDPLPELAELCRSEDLWFHVDAAWGGAAILSERLAGSLEGITLADSITCDAHKWLSVPMGAGMFFCRHRDAVLQSFRISTEYMPGKTDGALDPYTASLQWSRRFIRLKVFMTLAAHGLPGVAQLIEHQADMGVYLRNQLSGHGWQITNETPLPVVCFAHERIQSSRTATRQLADSVVETGEAWISDVAMTDGRPCLRACITSFRAQHDDVDRLVKLLQACLQPLGSE